MKTAVLLITFNRLDYVKESLKAIAAAKPPRLYIASDGPRPNKVGEREQVQAVRDYLLSHIDWPCEVHKRFLDTNSGGCKNGVSGAVTWFFENEREGIILEDDCVANLSFFPYCEKLLKKYRHKKRVWHIAGDAPVDVDMPETYYFAKIQHCWGWASWADRWKHFSLDLSNYGSTELKKFSEHESVQKYWENILDGLKRNEIDSWAYPWAFNIVAHDGLCINPAHNLITNIGTEGVHYSGNDKELNKITFSITKIKHPKKIDLDKKLVNRIWVEKFGIQDINIIKEIETMYSYDNKGFLFRHVIYPNGRHKFYVFGIRVLSYKPRFAPGAKVKGNFLYTKEKCPNGRRHVYICGIKVFSYSKKKKDCKPVVVPVAQQVIQPVEVKHDMIDDYKNSFEKNGYHVVRENGKIKIWNDIITIEGEADNTLWTAEGVFCTDEYNFDMNEKYVMFDIGFNLGMTSLHKAQDKNCVKIYAFEPFVPTYKLAMRNMELNKKLAKKITAFNYGLGDKDETIDVNYNHDRPGAMSSVKNVFSECDDVEQIHIKNASKILGPLFAKHKENIFLKIDCEGAEKQILPDLEKSGLIKKVDVIVMEWHFEEPTELVDLLLRNNFIVFRLNSIPYELGMIRAYRRK